LAVAAGFAPAISGTLAWQALTTSVSNDTSIGRTNLLRISYLLVLYEVWQAPIYLPLE
jgi:hypothetical protein